METLKNIGGYSDPNTYALGGKPYLFWCFGISYKNCNKVTDDTGIGPHMNLFI